MKRIFIALAILSSSICYSQACDTSKVKKIKTNTNNWSLSLSSGYINIPAPNLGNNVWGSANISYSKKKWSTTFWVGSNYWVEGRQPDLRIGISTTYTLFKW